MLGVVSTATDKEITRAYRKLAKQYHPDANPGSEERFKEISAAYDVLGDADKRKEYDEVRKHGPDGRRHSVAGSAARPAAGRSAWRTWAIWATSSVACSATGDGGPTTTRDRQRGADMEAALHLSFSDAVHGVTTSVNVPEDVRCSNCRGTGAAPGTATHTCPRCGGTGTLNDDQGLFSLSTVCPGLCRAGHPLRHSRARSARARVPNARCARSRCASRPGSRTGSASGSRDGAPPGRAWRRREISTSWSTSGKHPTFGRNGRNLTLTVPVTFPEAALGTTITVPTLDSKVTLKVPAGTASGTRMRVRGRGVPAGSGRNAGKPGDLMVKLEVIVPTELTDEQRAAVESLAAVTDEAPRAAVEG